MRLAAIDIGTNTVRLLVADVHGSAAPTHIERRLEITRLGRGVDRRRRLDPDAVDRTLDVAEDYVGLARRAGAERIEAAGTSVLRDAENREGFTDAFRARTGVPLRVLAGYEEGTLAYLGATWGLDAGSYVVCDIGGGSTELIAGRDRAEAMCSLELGSVRLRERCLPTDPPTPDELERARELIGTLLEEADKQVRPSGVATLVGVAGTVTTIAALVLKLRDYDPERVHGVRIPASAVIEWSERLARMRVPEIRALASVKAGRADVITAGSLILREVMERWGYEEMLVSERDILDGLILQGARGDGKLQDRPPVG